MQLNRHEVDIAIAKLRKYKSPGSGDQIQAELIQAGGETLVSATHKLITSIRNKEESREQWKQFIIVPVYKKGDETVLIIVGYIAEIIGDHRC
jgi:hypothetical protein